MSDVGGHESPAPGRTAGAGPVVGASDSIRALPKWSEHIMGIWTDLFIRSRDSVGIGKDRLLALIADAVESRIIVGPWDLCRCCISGRELVNPGLIIPFEGEESTRLVIRGDDLHELLDHLRAVPEGDPDLIIRIEGLASQSEPIVRAASMGDPWDHIARVYIVAMGVPTAVGDEFDQLLFGSKVTEGDHDDEEGAARGFQRGAEAETSRTFGDEYSVRDVDHPDKVQWK